jgi:hypothetical protein
VAEGTAVTLYHVSPAHYREAIEREGLDPEKCREPRGRVWFYVSERQAKAHAGWPRGSDVWAVDDSALDTRWDTPWDDAACYVTAVVPPELLVRL